LPFLLLTPFLLIALFLLPCFSCFSWFFLFVIPGGDLLLLLPLLVLSVTLPILSFRPKQFAHFANCEAQKPASLPKPLTSQDIRCCRCLLPQGMPSPNPPKPVKPLRQVTTIESTISMCIAIPSISLYIDRREQKAPERSGAFCTRSNRNHLNGILCEMDIPKISTLRRGKTEVRT